MGESSFLTENVQASPVFLTTGISFEQLFGRVRMIVERQYGIKVLQSSLAPNVTGKLTGTEIVVREDLPAELQFFVLVHFFGHAVQWGVSENWRRIAALTFGPDIDLPGIRSIVEEYEEVASRYGLGLLHELGILYLDQWVSEWFAADHTYLVEVYRGRRMPDVFDLELYSSFRNGPVKLLIPLAIPKFVPYRWIEQYAV